MRALIAAVVLGGTFGTATATVETLEADRMVVDIRVEVADPGDSVVAHLSFEDEELTLPLLDRGDGTFGIRTELEPKNYQVVFETLGEGGSESEMTTLTQMGAELSPEGRGTTTTVAEDGLTDESRSLLWLAIALGAASLSLLAFWVLGGRSEREDAEEPASSDEEE